MYKKQKYRQKSVVEKWYLITNLSSAGKIKKIYSQRMGIEAMFKDYKTGGYNLESAKANETRLNNLILLIAISYTLSSFQGQKIKNKGVQKYISRTNEKAVEGWRGLLAISNRPRQVEKKEGTVVFLWDYL
ncbi:transposase [Dapis sp. BLCC M229]|uniref:transposase n=1 Tax=Dapis sp. BLCC M229 TaxID=3400188 RepID=UPI003CEE8D8C